MNLLRRTLLALTASLTALTSAQAEISQFITKDGIAWNTTAANKGATLTIVGPTPFLWTRQFKEANAFTVSFDEISSKALSDGDYSFELVLHGTPEQAAQIANGGFQVSNGATGDFADEQVATKDNVIPDRTINQDALCVGLDCNNGEAFGFDIIRLKENNLRIHFQDTSTSSSFPSNDWRILINDTANGGANFFAIEDSDSGRQVFRIANGAPTSTLTLAGSGNVGVGTLTAQADLHLARGNSPTMRFEQNSSQGFSPQSWEVGGNETQFYVRNASAGGAVPFRVLPNALAGLLSVGDSAAPDRVTVDGDLFIGTDQVTPDYVFAPEYEVMSIEDHTASMYENRHLPFVQAAQVNDQGKSVINVSARSQGVLKELEIAHIYIAELHKRIEQLEQRLQQLED